MNLSIIIKQTMLKFSHRNKLSLKLFREQRANLNTKLKNSLKHKAYFRTNIQLHLYILLKLIYLLFASF